MNWNDYFEKVFTDELFDYKVEIINNYSLQKNHTLSVTRDEMKVYVAVLLLTGYLTPKNIRMFWENNSDVHNEAVSNAIRRNKFLEIHQYLHTCDNKNLQTEDKFAKLSEYFKLLNKFFKENFLGFFSFWVLCRWNNGTLLWTT